MSDVSAEEELGRCTLLRLRKVTRRVTQIYDQTLEPSGLTITQFGLLSHLLTHGGMSIGELAGHLVTDSTTLTRVLRPLERKGYIVIAANAADRRRRDVDLSASGQAVLRTAVPLWRRAQDQLQDLLGSRDHLALQHALGVSLDHLVQPGPAGSKPSA